MDDRTRAIGNDFKAIMGDRLSGEVNHARWL
jgi:hypothetical protein